MSTQSNAQIIFNQQMELMKEGKIGSTGRVITVTVEKEGQKVQEKVNEPEPIHTYKEWQRLGFQVEKGQKAIAIFTIWNFAENKKAEDEDEAPSLMKNGYYYMKKAAFFKLSQVKKAGEDNAAAAPEVEPEQVKKAARKSDAQKSFDAIVKNASKEKFAAFKCGSFEGITYATEGHQLMKTTDTIEAPALEAFEADQYKKLFAANDFSKMEKAAFTLTAKEIREAIKTAKNGRRNAKVVYTTGHGVTLNANYLLNAVVATGATEYKYTDHKSPVVFENDKTFYMVLPINTRNMPELEEGCHVIG